MTAALQPLWYNATAVAIPFFQRSPLMTSPCFCRPSYYSPARHIQFQKFPHPIFTIHSFNMSQPVLLTGPRRPLNSPIDFLSLIGVFYIHLIILMSDLSSLLISSSSALHVSLPYSIAIIMHELNSFTLNFWDMPLEVSMRINSLNFLQAYLTLQMVVPSTPPPALIIYIAKHLDTLQGVFTNVKSLGFLVPTNTLLTWSLPYSILSVKYNQ